MNYNMHVETLDGTIIDVPPTLDIKYPNQMNSFAEGLAKGDTNPQVYISVWKHDKGEVRKKFYSDACWSLETFALEMFEQMCREHDWYYEYSDDHNVWKRGRVAYSNLQSKYQWMLTKCPDAANVIWEMHNPFLKNKEHV
jgi:hypothetical protein